ncbi:MAG: 3-dehydroquinate synthase [bacterium]
MNRLKVDLGKNSYPIFIGNGILQNLGEMLKLYNFADHAVVVTDSNVKKQYGDVLAKTLENAVDSVDVIDVLPGEKSKTLRTIDRIITRMLEFGCDRNSVVLACGGGVVGDIAGFAASIFKRGVACVQVPTTLLAQVDSAIGGKTGVNHALGKNLLGTFHQPKMVWSDLAVLQTLPKREVICGLAEIIKYGVIGDMALFESVEQNLERIIGLDLELLQTIVTRCSEIKADVVAKDEKESGLRMSLNFGHTIGHALEAQIGYKKISHGEAVLLGMQAESRMAVELQILAKEEFERISVLVSGFGLGAIFSSIDIRALDQFMKVDKKATGGKLKFVLPRKIGEVDILEDVPADVIRKGIAELRN